MSRSIHIDYDNLRAREAATAAFQDALSDYYDSGAIGDAPKREDYDRV